MSERDTHIIQSYNWDVMLESVLPDLAKIRHFGCLLKSKGNFCLGLFSIWQKLSLLWQSIFAIGLIFIVVIGQILTK